MCDEMDIFSPQVLSSIFCCICVLLPTAIMLGVSFQAIQENEVGIRTNKHYGYVTASGSVESTGNHYVGLWYQYEIISKTQQNGGYTVTAYTNNIIQITVDVDIQYTVSTAYDDLYMILFDFDDIGQYMNSKVEDAIRRSVQSLPSDVFYNNRALVTSTLTGYVEPAISDCGYFLNALQLVEVTVPAEMSTAITDLVSAKQEIDVATNEKNKYLVAANADLNAAVHDADIAAKQSNQTADSNYDAYTNNIDAELYAKRKEIENIRTLILAYKLSYPAATDKQLAELTLTHRYTDTIGQVSTASGSMKIFMDHKPSAIGDISDALGVRYAA
jgi:regulator of protease activity HflC (stomatin/prohibitin superfamily)